jgi:phosphoribosylamine-glycine ligase
MPYLDFLLTESEKVLDDPSVYVGYTGMFNAHGYTSLFVTSGFQDSGNSRSTQAIQLEQVLDSEGNGIKVIIEDYVWGTPFSFYTITDGYKALPIGSSIMYKHSLEGDGGQLTTGMGACVPNYKLSVENEYFLMDNVIYPILESLEQEGNPYLGILGVSGVITEDGSLQVLGLENFLQDADADAVLEVIDADILELINSCVIGSFSDEVDFIPLRDLSATSLVLLCNSKENVENAIEGLDNLDEDIKTSFYPTVTKNRYLEYEANTGSVAVVTAFARTVSSSTDKVYEEVEGLNFKGIAYRKDICKSLVARY